MGEEVAINFNIGTHIISFASTIARIPQRPTTLSNLGLLEDEESIMNLKLI